MKETKPGRQAGRKAFLDVLKGRENARRPIWMMRQAGRYLPEYRDVRKQAGSFLALCGDPKLASEVTLQPLRRFDLDAAIIFADILLLPKALGQKLEFQEGEGPVLEPVSDTSSVAALSSSGTMAELEPVFDALDRVSGELPPHVSLIGFCGAPWTVATYMIAGHGTIDQRPAREAAYRGEPWFEKLIDLLVETSVEYLIRQVGAGAEVLQVFDTWAGVLSDTLYDRWCIAPTRDIVSQVKASCPDVPIIGFPRGSGLRYQKFVSQTGVDAVSLDWSVPLDWARQELQPIVPVQGNLDPIVLAAGGPALASETQRILDGLSSDRHIFNLGHGILPDTPISHVEGLIAQIRDLGPAVSSARSDTG